MAQSAVGSLIPAKTIAQTPDPSYHAAVARKRRQKRLRSAVLHGGRRSGPGTPLLRWKFDNGDRQGEVAPEVGVKGRRKKKSCDGAPAVSARRLAAGIWQLYLPEFGSGGGEGRRGQVVSEHIPGHLQNKSVPIHGSSAFHACRRNEFVSPMSDHNTENFMLQKLDGPAALPDSVMEKATKWDPGRTKASDEVYRFYSHLKLLEDQQVTTVSVVSTLQAELEQSRAQIAELEAERNLAKKKMDHFFRKVEEEKASWRSKEHKKIRAILDDMKVDLNRERKSRQRMEIMNSKLVNELTEAKLSAKRFMQDYEKERKNSMLMEEVCDELAKEMGEDKAEVDALKKESLMVREEVEEERKMLQMAEIWREERVQMKLVDAKLTLEDKYAQLSKLQADLEAFLKERRNANLDEGKIKEADALVKAVVSVGIQDIEELTYQPPPASEDIFSVFEELQHREDDNEIEIQPCCEFSPESHASKVHTVSPDINGLLEKTKYNGRYMNGVVDINDDAEDDSGWETVSHIEEQGSSFSPEGSDPSVNGFCQESNASLISGTDWEEHGVPRKSNSEISEVCSVGTKQSRKTVSSIVRLWKSSGQINGENPKKIYGRMSNATLSPERQSGEIGSSPRSLGQWSSPDSVNPPYVTHATKGCIEWPRGMQKQSLKAKLLEARMQNQKIQLKQVLKQKI